MRLEYDRWIKHGRSYRHNRYHRAPRGMSGMCDLTFLSKKCARCARRTHESPFPDAPAPCLANRSGNDLPVALCANGAAPRETCVTSLVDSTGDGATTAEDVGGIVAVVNGAIQADELLCQRNIDTSTP